jgi:hypothetical protein
MRRRLPPLSGLANTRYSVIVRYPGMNKNVPRRNMAR